MRAAVFRRLGDPSAVLSVEDVATPVVSPGEVLVEVDASVVQPADLMFIRGNYRIRPSFPQVAGLEGTGMVVATGTAATVSSGTRVSFRHPGAWAEHVAVPCDRCYVVPDEIPIDAAAQFALNPVTAWGLLDELTADTGDWIAVSAARSAIARIVARIAERRGLRVIGLVREAGPEPLDYPVVDTAEDDLASQIMERTGGVLLAGFLDSVGGATVFAVFPALRPGATIVSYGVLDDSPIPVRNSDLIYRNLIWKGFGIDYWLATTFDRRESMTAELWRLIRDGVLELPLGAHHTLDQIELAVDAAASSPPGFKVLVRIGPATGRAG
jgi:NADPH:quinone reductase-like Zn-dependent oxidoreductase